MRSIAVLAFSVLLVGCSPKTTPIASDGDQVQPTANILDQALVTARDGAGIIIVTRDKGFTAGNCTFNVLVDGKAAAGLLPTQQVRLFVEPGERIIGVAIRQERGCPKSVAQVQIDAQTGVTKKVRVGLDWKTVMRLEPSAL